jgi:hypothetical protein
VGEHNRVAQPRPCTYHSAGPRRPRNAATIRLSITRRVVRTGRLCRPPPICLRGARHTLHRPNQETCHGSKQAQPLPLPCQHSDLCTPPATLPALQDPAYWAATSAPLAVVHVSNVATGLSSEKDTQQCMHLRIHKPPGCCESCGLQARVHVKTGRPASIASLCQRLPQPLIA